MKTLLSAVQPSNRLTIGNYLGALKNWADMQAEYDCIFFAVDLHAITVRQDPARLYEQTYLALATYLASGINPERATIFVQSHVPQHTELGWILTTFAQMGELGRMTQYKDKSSKLAENEGIGVGLFMYPVLMAADILLYGTDVVPVGDDQLQHLQLARDLAQRFNRFADAEVFKVPEGITPKVGARIMSLQDPTRKMSKSDPDPLASVYLSDTDENIDRKVKRAVTDSGEEVTYDTANKPGVANLIQMLAACTDRPISEVVDSFAGKRYGHLKAETADAIIARVAPIRNEVNRIMADRSELNDILLQGALAAGARADFMLENVYRHVGFLPR